jgi:threonine dehydrogenase-like Zn-dependent dehydrogenase
MIAAGELRVDHLISHVAKPEAASTLFQQIVAGPQGWMSVFFDWT